MFYSMTGYGTGQATSKKMEVLCEIKSVNNRFLDISFRGYSLPNDLEEYIKNQEKENDQEVDKTGKKEKEDLSPEEKIKDLEDKLTRSLAEMENQRRRFEKEKEDAFEYGGFALAKESLNLIDNLERLKQSLINDESLKDTDAFKKISEHLDIIYNDIISIF